MRHNILCSRRPGAQRPTRYGTRHGGFTLVQILMVVGLISLLSAMLLGQFGRSREAVRREQCDVHLKGIVLAMDTFRQETGHLPTKLIDLQTMGYVPLETLRCPADPNLSTEGSNAKYTSYADSYVLRDALDSGELPTIVCPFHEKEGEHGAQGFKGGYTNTFAARPATLGGIAGAVTVTRPGEGVLAIPATGKLEVRGGDRIQVGAGNAMLTFADGSQASLSNNSEMSVLQSYMAAQTSDSIYTLVRQFAGTISYSVIPGNKFDVATPTATAGALGTKFTIQIVDPLPVAGRVLNSEPPPQEALLTVTQHVVAFTCKGRTINVGEGEPAVRSDDPGNSMRPHMPRDNKKSLTAPAPTPMATAGPAPTPAPTATPSPTATPKPKKEDGDDGNNGKGNG